MTSCEVHFRREHQSGRPIIYLPPAVLIPAFSFDTAVWCQLDPVRDIHGLPSAFPPQTARPLVKFTHTFSIISSCGMAALKQVSTRTYLAKRSEGDGWRRASSGRRDSSTATRLPLVWGRRYQSWLVGWGVHLKLTLALSRANYVCLQEPTTPSPPPVLPRVLRPHPCGATAHFLLSRRLRRVVPRGLACACLCHACWCWSLMDRTITRG